MGTFIYPLVFCEHVTRKLVDLQLPSSQPLVPDKAFIVFEVREIDKDSQFTKPID